MRLSMECLPCLVNQAIRIARLHLPGEEEQRRLVKRVILELASLDDNASAPYAAHLTQRILKEALQNPDPYKEAKQYYNEEMLIFEDDFLRLAKDAADPLYTALKIAAAGNYIDFGPGYDLSRDNILQTLQQTLERDYAPDVFSSLNQSLANSPTLLYLGDNTGEIVFDKVFIRIIKEQHPELEIYFATRGQAVLNDVTEVDAYTVGMDAYARIINNGTDIPGTILEHCSDNFREIFDKADIVIAKGLGNFESLYGSAPGKIFYIFLCKCKLFMERFGAGQNDIILLQE